MATTALILEGGGYRGIYTGGVLDTLLLNGITGFDSVWGVSAGALNAANFKAHQIGRTLRVMLAFRDDRRMMSLYSLVTTGNITNADFMYNEVQNTLDPFDNDAFNTNLMQMYAVASDVVFGTAAYLPVKRIPDDLLKIQASASIPGISQMVEIDGHRYLDGGMADSVPAHAALGLIEGLAIDDYTPADKAVVVLTRERSYIKESNSQELAIRTHRYDQFPYFVETLKSRGQRYNKQREQLWELEREGKALIIAPENKVVVKVNETKGEPLLSLYLEGLNQTKKRLEEIRHFINN